MISKRKIIVGSRKSRLAVAQAEFVANALKKLFPSYEVIIKGIITSGDLRKKWPKFQAKGIFVKEIEEALKNKTIDLAVHSMKDLPVDIAQGLEIAAVTKRLPANDVLISRNGEKLNKLKKFSRIGTSSPRRKMQLLLYRPDLKIKDIRGNLDTRLKKVKGGNFDAVVVAAAGLLRLGWEKYITENISEQIMLCAPAQGALAIEIRKDDYFIRKLVKRLNHLGTKIAITAEREFLRAMGGGCRVPIAAFAQIRKNKLYLQGIVGDEKARFAVRQSIIADKNSPEKIGQKLAKKIKNILKKQMSVKDRYYGRK